MINGFQQLNFIFFFTRFVSFMMNIKFSANNCQLSLY